MATEVIRVGEGCSASAAGRRAAEALRAGKIVGFPTETVYGIGALATIGEAFERLRELKDRPSRPFSIHMGGAGELSRYVVSPASEAKRLIAKAWPGPVTLLLPTGGRFADEKLQKAGLHDLLTYEGCVGLRCPDEPAALEALAGASGPIVASSGNLTGRPSPRTAQEVLEAFDGRIDMLIDAGPTKYGKDSTVVRVGPVGLEVLREGVFDEREIQRMLRRRILFVCTGNTCRSPIAAGLAKTMLAERLGCSVGQLRQRGVEVGSAGLFASDGSRATPEAVDAARELGADLSHHRGRKLTEQLIAEADVVFCMMEFHVGEVRRLAPGASRRVERLDARRDIPDPIGSGSGGYRRTAERIRQVLTSRLDELGF